MKKNIRIGILLVLIIITTFIIIKQSNILYEQFKSINMPNKETRKIGNMSTHNWITVKKISEKYNMSQDNIFKSLQIIPQNGDENLYIKDLAKKYNKTQEEMKNNLKKIIESDVNKGVTNIEGKKNE